MKISAAFAAWCCQAKHRDATQTDDDQQEAGRTAERRTQMCVGTVAVDEQVVQTYLLSYVATPALSSLERVVDSLVERRTSVVTVHHSTGYVPILVHRTYVSFLETLLWSDLSAFSKRSDSRRECLYRR